MSTTKTYRIEKDFLGEKQIPEDAYYGVQTQRGKDNFHITGTSMSAEPYFVKAFGYVKKAAAMANRDLGCLDGKIANAIIGACDRLIAGELREQFVTDFIQGGAGTSVNMNANEVIANVALEALGHNKGDYHIINYGGAETPGVYGENQTDASQTGSSGGAETRPRNAAINYVISYL